MASTLSPTAALAALTSSINIFPSKQGTHGNLLSYFCHRSGPEHTCRSSTNVLQGTLFLAILLIWGQDLPTFLGFVLRWPLPCVSCSSSLSFPCWDPAQGVSCYTRDWFSEGVSFLSVLTESRFIFSTKYLKYTFYKWMVCLYYHILHIL